RLTRSDPSAGVTEAMHTKKRAALCSLAALAALTMARLTQVAPAAQNARTAVVPDITGSWERYAGGILPSRADALRNDPARPPAAPPPPLKPQYLKEWQARVQASRDADAKGTPLASNATHCL